MQATTEEIELLISEVGPFVGAHAPPPGSNPALRSQMGAIALRAARTGAPKWHALAYIRAARRYIEDASRAHPVAADRVAENGVLLPTESEPDAAEERCSLSDLLVLAEPGGGGARVFANPLRLAWAMARPAAPVKIAAPGCELKSAAEFAAAHAEARGEFHWREDRCPIGAVLLDTGALMIPTEGGRRWLEIRPGLVPSIRAPEKGSDAAARNGRGARRPEQTSALKGARGEARVFQILARGHRRVVQVSHRARSADLVVSSPAGPILVESKDYTIAVPDKEIRKFRRDLADRDAAAGVLVSLSSGIVGVKGAISSALEALPVGRLVPVVYVASGHEDVIAAGVDLAAHLAAHTRTLPAPELHPRDALEAYVASLEEIGDLFQDARAELQRTGLAAVEGRARVSEKLGAALLEHRRAVRAQRAAIQPVEDCDAKSAPALAALFAARYAVPPGAAEALAAVLGILGGTAAGDTRPAARWRFLKTKAVCLESRIFLVFRKARIELGVPLTLLTKARIGELAVAFPKKVRLADGSLTLELDTGTGAVAQALLQGRASARCESGPKT